MLFLGKTALWLENWGNSTTDGIMETLMKEGVCMVEFTHGASQSK